MKTKTIRLRDGFRLRGEVVDVFVMGDLENMEDPGRWKPTRYRVGEHAILVSLTDVSPNAIRDGSDIPRFFLKFGCPDGIPGNSNPSQARYHGWRGTTNDSCLEAHGERQIIKIRQLSNGAIAVTVGADLQPDAD